MLKLFFEASFRGSSGVASGGVRVGSAAKLFVMANTPLKKKGGGGGEIVGFRLRPTAGNQPHDTHPQGSRSDY